jgi:hypothetical protein
MLARVARRRVVLLAGVAALFSGVALLGQLLAGIALPLGLAFSVTLLVIAVLVIRRLVEGPVRRQMLAVAATAAAIGFVGILAYDASRAILVQLDPSDFDPFEALPIFGRLLLGDAVSEQVALAAGIGFHLTNGVTFAIGYGFILGRYARRSMRLALATGVGWGLFLETFQLTLYPGWLNIKTYQEFVTITFLGHVAYGGTLGMLANRFLPPIGDPDEPDDDEEAAPA